MNLIISCESTIADCIPLSITKVSRSREVVMSGGKGCAHQSLRLKRVESVLRTSILSTDAA